MASQRLCSSDPDVESLLTWAHARTHVGARACYRSRQFIVVAGPCALAMSASLVRLNGSLDALSRPWPPSPPISPSTVTGARLDT